MPKNSIDADAPTEATAVLRFTILPFISGTGTGAPVLCAIIFRSA